MKKILITLLLLIPSLCFAKTATVEYSFTDFTNYQVIIWVSENPGINTATQMFGQIDDDEDGIVDIGNIEPGKTYYFRARAYNKLTGSPTGWSDELSKVVPTETLPSPLSLPVIPDVVIPGFILDSITYKAQ